MQKRKSGRGFFDTGAAACKSICCLPAVLRLGPDGVDHDRFRLRRLHGNLTLFRSIYDCYSVADEDLR